MPNVKKTAVIGVGNILFCDDGVGVFAAEYLRQNFSFEPEIEIVDGGTSGYGLFEYFSAYEQVVVLDTLSLSDDAGAIYTIPSHELLGLGGYKKTAHEVEIVQLLEMCELHEAKAEITVIGIVAKDIKSARIGLSEFVKEKFDLLIRTVLDTLENLGIRACKKENLDLDAIIKKF